MNRYYVIKGLRILFILLLSFCVLFLALSLFFISLFRPERRIHANPPAFHEMLRQFEEISAEQSEVSFLKHRGIVYVALIFVGDEESQKNIPFIRDTVFESITSEPIINFFLYDYGIKNIGAVGITFFTQEKQNCIVLFTANAMSDFKTWYVDGVGDFGIASNFARGYGNENVRMLTHSRMQTDELMISYGSWLTNGDLSEREIEYEFTNHVIDAVNEMKSDIPNFINGPLNDFLEGLHWLPIDEGFIIRIELSLKGSPGYGDNKIWRENMIFARKPTGIWERITS